MATYIRIIRQPYEEPYLLNLIIQACHEHQGTSLEYYCNADDLIKCAEALENFPRHSKDSFVWEFGSEVLIPRSEEYVENKCAYFFFRVFTTDSTGHCAIQLRTNNNESYLPDRELAEFCIRAQPSQINLLGYLFRKFALLEHEVLFWSPEGGELYQHYLPSQHGSPFIKSTDSIAE